MHPDLLPTSLCLPDPTADEELARRVTQFLRSQRPELLRRIELAAEDGIVTVQGTLRTFYERQLAIACIGRVAGVRRVVDFVVVMDDVPPRLGRIALQHEVLP